MGSKKFDVKISKYSLLLIDNNDNSLSVNIAFPIGVSSDSLTHEQISKLISDAKQVNKSRKTHKDQIKRLEKSATLKANLGE